MSVTPSQWCRVADCSRASDRQQRTLGRQQSDEEFAARRAAAKTPTADVAVTGYPPSIHKANVTWKVNVEINLWDTSYSASSWHNLTTEALRYGTHAFIRERYEPSHWLTSRSRFSGVTKAESTWLAGYIPRFAGNHDFITISVSCLSDKPCSVLIDHYHNYDYNN